MRADYFIERWTGSAWEIIDRVLWSTPRAATIANTKLVACADLHKTRCRLRREHSDKAIRFAGVAR